MRIFLDTCALFKLYHNEEDTIRFENIFVKNTISSVFISELTKLEFSSTLWKKVRTKEITGLQAKQTISIFNSDLPKYHIVRIDSEVIKAAINLIAKYGDAGLRTLDSIQLATALLIKQKADLFVTADKLLLSLFDKERLTISF